MTLSIEQISTADDIAAAINLVRALVTLAVSLDPDAKDAPTFRNLENELASLPGIFGPPSGCFLLARHEGRPVGCVAFTRHGDDVVEFKAHVCKP